MACVKKFFNAIADYGVIVKAQAILFYAFHILGLSTIFVLMLRSLWYMVLKK